MNKLPPFRLLLAEDDEQDLQSCRDAVERQREEQGRVLDLIECKNPDQAMQTLDSSFDGAIIDLKLGDQGDEGTKLVRRIKERHYRIPVAILTGTPDAADLDFAYLGVFKKGEPGSSYSELLDIFWDIHRTGLTRIMGGRGKIEEALEQVFKESLLPQRGQWVEYGKEDTERTEKALLRHALDHLLQLLSGGEELCFPEEVYLVPPLKSGLQTGSIMAAKDGERYYVVLTPACDLVPRKGGTSKADQVLLAEIQRERDVILPAQGNTKPSKGTVKAAFRNKTDYHHWLPKTSAFEGGFINFRSLQSVSAERFEIEYEQSGIQISPAFVKDIVAWFSSYYARQGQPEIDRENAIKRFLDSKEQVN